MKRKTLVSVFVTAAVMATGAMAYFFVAGFGEGEGHAELGKGTPTSYPVKVAFANGLVPGASEKVEFTLEPTVMTDIKTLTVTPSIDKEHEEQGCLPSFFTVTTKNSFWKKALEGTQATPTKVPPGAMNLEGQAAGYELSFADNGTNQSACESAHLTIKAVATP